jgi:hypothetical protein
VAEVGTEDGVLGAGDDDVVVTAARAGDEAAFAALVERHRVPLRVHCRLNRGQPL